MTAVVGVAQEIDTAVRAFRGAEVALAVSHNAIAADRAYHPTGPAIKDVACGIETYRAADDLIPGTIAGAHCASGLNRTDRITSAAMIGIGLKIGAERFAHRLIAWAFALTIHTRGAKGARIAAGTARAFIGEQIGTNPIAIGPAWGASADTRLTHTIQRTLNETAAAMIGIGLGIDALAIAHLIADTGAVLARVARIAGGAIVDSAIAILVSPIAGFGEGTGTNTGRRLAWGNDGAGIGAWRTIGGGSARLHTNSGITCARETIGARKTRISQIAEGGPAGRAITAGRSA